MPFLNQVKFQNSLFLILFLLFANSISAQVTTVISPTVNNGGFEQGTSGWSFQSNSGVNKWNVGTVPTAGYTGAGCAFVSNSTGIPYQHQYTTTSASISKLYRDVYFPANTNNFVLKFKTLTQGAYNATLTVYLLPSDQVLDPNLDNNLSVSPLFTLATQGASWVNKQIDLSPALLGNASVGVTKKLVFIWHNYVNASGTQPPAAIDDISIDNCYVANNITSTNSTNEVTLNWDSLDTSWILRYKIGTSGAWTEVPVSSKPYTLSGLVISTNYIVQVKNANLECNGWSSDYNATTTPLNSTCLSAVQIDPQEDLNSSTIVVANFTGATMSSPTPVCSNTTIDATSGNLWFTFTANATRYILDANNSLKAELFKGTDCNSLVYQYCKTGFTYLDNLEVGSQYYLRLIDLSIYNPNYSGNQFNFRLVKAPDAPANDLCSNAVLLTGTATVGNLTGANIELASQLSNAMYQAILGDVWYKFVATENYATVVGVPASSQTINIDIYSGDCNSLAGGAMGQFDSYSGGSTKDTGLLQIGTTYYLRVYNSYVNRNWPFTINIIPRPSPANNLCDNATPIVLDADGETQLVVPSTTYATSSVGVASTCSTYSTKDVWYQFTAGTEAYLISSSYMTNIYSGSCGSFTQVGCGTTYIIGNLTIGQVYFIRVYDGQTITIREFFAADECNSSTVLIPALNPNFTYSSTISATAGALPTTCIANNKDVWFQFTATSTKNKITLLNAYATSLSEAVAITIYSGDCNANALTQMGCYSFLNNNNLNVTLNSYVVGQTYYIKATRASSTYFGIKVIPLETQPNNEIATAIAFTPDEPTICTLISGSTAGADPSVSIPTPCNSSSSSADVWYSFVATVPSYKITYNTAGYHSFTIYKADASNALTLFTCLTENVSGFEVGTTYYIRVGSSSETYTQTFTFCISKIMDTPVNDECLNAITIPVATTMTCTDSILGSLSQATYNVTNQIAAACIYGSMDKDIWYQFTATSAKLLFNNTGDPNKVIRYALLQGSCNSLTCMYSDSLNGLETKVISNLIIGVTYFLKISYVNDNAVSFCMSTAPVIVNDLCQNATELIPSNDLSCTTIRNYTCSEPSTSLTVSGCTGSIPLYLYNASTTYNYGDAWYKFTATSAEHVMTFVNGGGYVQLFEGNCNGLSCHSSYNYSNTSNDKDFLFSQLTVGQVYYIRILNGLSYHDFGYYDICLKTPTSIPSNDEYTNAMVLVPTADLDTCNPVSNVFNRATNSSSIQTPSCVNSNNPKDVWFQFTATSTHHQLQIHLSNPQALLVSFFTSLYSSVNGVVNQEVSCFDPLDNVIPNLDVSLGGSDYNTNYYYPLMLQNYYNLTVGATYYIRMYPYVQQQYDYSILMPYDVCLKTLPEIPTNNNYTTALPLTVSPYDNFQYVSGYATRAAYHVTEPYNNVTNPCGELGAFAWPSNQATNVWYKFTAQQTSEALHVINDANILFPITNYTPLQYYILYAALYEYNNSVMETKQCYADTATNIVFSNLEVGKEYYLKMMYRQILYQTDFEFQVSVANITELGQNSWDSNSITVYPNPTHDIMTLANPNHIALKSVQLYTLLGQLVYEKKVATQTDVQVDMSTLQKGAYILKVKSEESENSYSVLKN